MSNKERNSSKEQKLRKKSVRNSKDNYNSAKRKKKD